MPVTPQTIPIGSTSYPSLVDTNFSLLAAAINALEAQMVAVGGEGRQLPLDMFDRDGVVGAASYRLAWDEYSGGASIKVGRRPVPNIALGDQDVSIGWMTVGGVKTRVTLTGDATLSAAGIVSGLPKSIYIGVPSNGTPQFYETLLTPNVLYLYKLTWDGFNLTNPERLAHVLPGYTLIQELHGAPRLLSIFDSETDWASDLIGSSAVVIPGASDDNGIGVEASMEVLGFFAAYSKTGPDGIYAPAGPDNKVRFKVMANGEAWTETDIELDCSLVADEVYRKVLPAIGTKKYVTEVTRFTLERTYKGAHVVSARAFTWGAIVRPLLGAPVAKDSTKVSQV